MDHSTPPIVYCDNNATTPCAPEVVAAMQPWWFEKFGNAASQSHRFGKEAALAVERAREQVAHAIGAHPFEIVFTSGATEAINLALQGLVRNAPKGTQVITCATEHKAVLEVCADLEQQGYPACVLSVNENGLINLDELAKALQQPTALVCVQWANNETGVLQPVKEIGSLCSKAGVPFFTDAVQAVGKELVDVQAVPVDLMAISAHKLYGPKGIGALYIRSKEGRLPPLKPMIIGGGHEKGLRAGTLNVPAIVGFGKACALLDEEHWNAMKQIESLRDQVEQHLMALGGVYRNGDTVHRLKNTSNLSFEGVEAQLLLEALQNDLAASTGSACTSSNPAPSHVLQAMGYAKPRIHQSIRLSLGKYNTEEELDRVVAAIGKAVAQFRR